MYITFVVVIISLVISLLIVNIYFRVRVFKYYKSLVQADVEFDLSHVLNKKKLEAEVIPRYPQSEQDINQFIHHLKLSFRIGMILFVLISLFGWVLMHYR
ncbi:hypothetical protein GCM10007940_40050 [Portibacter lacus]|uniref:Uncharacterized protein n=1 Tax=Portibacter lacus TaxID=1099794 RepID=A0AA37STB0_9BACT|nr:hypothetical protein GCM10007940_40050 [Portibacter lacus]